MKKNNKTEKKTKNNISVIEKMALEGRDINHFFSGGKMMPPLKNQVQRVNVDFKRELLEELDKIATELNVSRQSIIKMFVQRELDRHFLAKKARKDVA